MSDCMRVFNRFQTTRSCWSSSASAGTRPASSSLGEYQQVRLDSRHFAIVPGHEIPDAERVVGMHERFELVEKIGAAVEFADATDTRAPGEAGRRDG